MTGLGLRGNAKRVPLIESRKFSARAENAGLKTSAGILLRRLGRKRQLWKRETACTIRTLGVMSASRFMKMIANKAMMIRHACKSEAWFPTAKKHFAETATASKKHMPMTSIQNKFFLEEAGIERLLEADQDEKRQRPIKV